MGTFWGNRISTIREHLPTDPLSLTVVASRGRHTSDHKPGGIKQQKCILSLLWKPDIFSVPDVLSIPDVLIVPGILSQYC